MRHGAGMGNMILDFQFKVMIAWLTGRPVVMLSKTMFALLRSRYMPPEVQLSDYADFVSRFLKIPKAKAEDEGYLFDFIRGREISGQKMFTGKVRFAGLLWEAESGKNIEVDL